MELSADLLAAEVGDLAKSQTSTTNLLPVCVKHHTLVHHGGWELHLAPDRTLTVTLPDHTTRTTCPPKRTAT